jgi:DNA mismatch repair protein MutS2
MRAEVLSLVEFTKITEWLAELTSAPTAARLARALAPRSDAAAVRRALQEIAEGKALAETRGPWPGPPPYTVTEALDRDVAEGGIATARGLWQAAELLTAVSRAAAWWREAKADAPHAAALAEPLAPDPALEKRLRASVDAEGLVLDGASPELAAVRKQQDVARGRLRDKLDRYKSLAAEEGSFVTQRNDRFVVAVRADRFERSKGLVHDVSTSGATLFVEPFEVCTLNNELAELAARERAEVVRVLRALTERVRAGFASLVASEDALAATDLLWARVRLSKALAGSTPEVKAGGDRLVLRGARHPLLWREAEGARDAAAARRKVVPLELALAPPQRVVLVSGPNMGGKTVALKTVGLCALMAQSGLDVPAEPGAVLPLFETVLADIGDAQSIEQGLSTFAAHLGRLDAMARSAGPRALFLLDEVGAGTDPAEGASLGRAALKHFAHAGAWAIATTHLGSLKLLAQEEDAIVNASMALDPETLAPRYELVVGVPGGSHALHIAERLGFHPGVLAEARRDLPEAARSLEALLEDVTKERALAQDARAAAIAAEARAKAAEEALETERRELTESARVKGKERLLQIRALESQVQGLLREAKAEARSEEKSRARIQELEARVRAAARAGDALADAPPLGAPAVLVPGATVFVRDLGVTATVVEPPDREGRVLLERGTWRIQSRAEQCFAPESAGQTGGSRGGGAGAGGPAGAGSGSGARAARARGGATAVSHEPEPGTGEIDLRGHEADEAVRLLETGLDRAVLGGLDVVRVIHGVGKGVLRAAVAEALRRHPHVAEQRLGGHGEGGRGVTIVRLR